MQAIRVPYPLPTYLPTYKQLRRLEHYGRIVDFPDRHLSYVLSDCKQCDIERAILALLKAVDAQPRGTEPTRLEIRLAD